MTTSEFGYLPVRVTRAAYSGIPALAAAAALAGSDLPARIVLAAVVLVAGGWLVWRSLRIGLVVRPGELVVRNVFRDHHVPVGDVELVDALGTVDLLRARIGFSLWRAECVRIVRGSGGTLLATGAAGKYALPAVDAVRAAAAA
jgi:hypothetical protein